MTRGSDFVDSDFWRAVFSILCGRTSTMLMRWRAVDDNDGRGGDNTPWQLTLNEPAHAKMGGVC